MMQAIESKKPVPRSASGGSGPRPPAPFTPPGAGSWALDASHCERPVPRCVEDAFVASFTRGMREGMATYGALLETIEVACVNGFIYTCPRPVGAPAGRGHV